MINMIRAEFYRIFRSKGFYYTQILLIGLVVLSIVTKTLGSVGMQVEEVGTISDTVVEGNWHAFQSLEAMSSMFSFLIFFLLPFFVIIIGSDLTQKTYKNLLTTGISRTKYLLSKYVIFLVLSALQLLFYYVATFFSAWAVHGLGNMPKGFVLHFLEVIGMQFISLQAVFALGLIVLILTFSNTIAVTITILYAFLIGIVVALLPKISALIYFDFQAIMNASWQVDLTEAFWLKAILASLTVITGSLVLSSYLFDKKNF